MRLIFDTPATEAIARMPEIPHDLFTLECLDLRGAPQKQGSVIIAKAGGVTQLSRAVGSMGFIFYEVDEEAATLTITNIISVVD
jgi:hypothetical protein